MIFCLIQPPFISDLSREDDYDNAPQVSRTVEHIRNGGLDTGTSKNELGL